MGKRGTDLDKALGSDLLYRFAPVSTLLTLGAGILFALTIWPAADEDVLRAWLATVAFASLLRLTLVLRYRRSPPPASELQRWRVAYFVSTAVMACAWGATPLLFFTPGQPHYVLLLAIVLEGLAAAVILSLALAAPGDGLYVAIIIIPLLIRLVVTGEPLYVMSAVIIAMLSGAMLAFSRWVHLGVEEARRIGSDDSYRNDVMEMLASGAPLPEILQAIVLGVEARTQGGLCSILLLDPAGKHVVHGAAAGLPEFYVKAIDRSPVGPAAGSCGTAIYTGKRVIVEDIRTHAYWNDYREAALKAGLMSCWSQPIKSTTGKVLGAFAIYHRVPGKPGTQDIRRIEIAAHLAGIAIERKSLQEDHELAALVYQHSSEAMVVSDARNHVVAINEAFTKITGYGADEIIGKGLVFSARNASDRADYGRMMESVLAAGHWRGELWNYRKNGERFACCVTVNSIRDADGGVNRRVILLSDITEQKRADELIWKQANYDPLIGLPNRRLFRDRLEQEIRKAHRMGRRVALLFLDLDRFKEVNDSLGHDAGDKLLVEAAARITGCVRDSDTVARIGGDEFTIILSQISDNTIVERVARDIVERMVQPFSIGGHVAYVSVSIGITVYPDDTSDIEDLLKNADMSMYAAKSAGRNRYHYFTSATQDDAQKRGHIINDLRFGLDARQFVLHYQPIVEFGASGVRHAEALLRWRHPHLGLIDPLEFLPHAEETGLIDEIGDWVFQEAARAAKRFGELMGIPFQVSVNVSPMQLRMPNRCLSWLPYLEEIALPPDRLNLDVSEAAFVEGGQAVELIDSFRQAGMTLALDDFSSGRSLLACAHRLKIDAVKIGHALIEEAAAADGALAQLIVLVARKLGLRVIAEGIETSTQHEALRKAGCDYGQGYWLAKPMPQDEFEHYLRHGVLERTV